MGGNEIGETGHCGIGKRKAQAWGDAQCETVVGTPSHGDHVIGETRHPLCRQMA